MLLYLIIRVSQTQPRIPPSGWISYQEGREKKPFLGLSFRGSRILSKAKTEKFTVYVHAHTRIVSDRSEKKRDSFRRYSISNAQEKFMLSPYHPCVIRKRKLVGNILIYRVRYRTWKRERERTDNNDGIVDKWENGKIGFVDYRLSFFSNSIIINRSNPCIFHGALYQLMTGETARWTPIICLPLGRGCRHWCYYTVVGHFYVYVSRVIGVTRTGTNGWWIRMPVGERTRDVMINRAHSKFTGFSRAFRAHIERATRE